MTETDLRESLSEPVGDYARSPVTVSASEAVSAAAREMKEGRETEAIVVEDGKPVGILTERDILYKVVAEGKNPSSIRVSDVMSSPVETLEGTASVGDAIARMSRLKIRRLVITRNGRMVGLVTAKGIILDRPVEPMVLPELSGGKPGAHHCPYCGETVKDANELSRHIDLVHVGKGLLEGELSKWQSG